MEHDGDGTSDLPWGAERRVETHTGAESPFRFRTADETLPAPSASGRPTSEHAPTDSSAEGFQFTTTDHHAELGADSTAFDATPAKEDPGPVWEQPKTGPKRSFEFDIAPDAEQPASEPGPDPEYNHGTREPATSPNIGPKVFLSYRRRDSEQITEQLASKLRDDLGGTQVFRDQDDIQPGQDWAERLVEEIDNSDALFVLVGNQWESATQSQPVGEQDYVDQEVRQALEQDHTTCVPILVDRSEPPAALPPMVATAFKNLQRIEASSTRTFSLQDVAYQMLLVAAWHSKLKKDGGDGIPVVIGSDTINADAFLRDLRESRRLRDASRLSQIAAGVYVAYPKKHRAFSRRWPDAVVHVGDNPNDPEVAARVAAVRATPGFKRVALVGGAAAAFVAGIGIAGSASASGSSATATAFTTTSSFAAAVPGAGIAASVGVAAASVATVAGLGIGVAELWPDPEPPSAFPTSIVLSPDTESSSPFGTNDDVRVEMRPIGGDEDLREVSVTFDDTGQTVDLGELDLSKLADDAAQIGAGEITLDALVQDDAVHSTSSFEVSDHCFNTEDRDEIIGGFRFLGDSLTVVLIPSITTADGKVSGAKAVVQLWGQVELERTQAGLDGDFDYSDCESKTTSLAIWEGTHEP